MHISSLHIRSRLKALESIGHDLDKDIYHKLRVGKEYPHIHATAGHHVRVFCPG